MCAWEKVRLAKVIELIGGGTPKTTIAEYWNGTIPWLSVVDFNNDYRKVYNAEKTITPLGLEKSSTKLLKENDIIISARGTVGAMAQLGRPMAFNQSCYGVRGKEGIDNTFLYYLLKTKVAELKKNSHGSVFSTITRDTFESIDVLLPPFEEQKRIAAILSSLDEKIENNNAINRNLEEQAQALFKSWFVDFEPFGGVMPSDWHEGVLGDIAQISTKAFNPLKAELTMLEHYSIPAFDSKKFPEFEYSSEIKSNKFVIDSDCCLISKLNPTTKRVWRPNCISTKSVCSTEFIVFKAINKENTTFLYSLIDSEAFTNYMCSHVTGSTGSRQRTTPSVTLNYTMFFPSSDVIVNFTKIVFSIYEKIKNNSVEGEKLTQLRDTLLPKLMSGEIHV